MTIAALSSDDQLMTFISGLGLLALFFWYFATDFQRKKRNIGTIIIVLIAVFSFLSIIPQDKWGSVLSGKSSLKEAHSLKGGIDLVGGSAFTLRVQPNVDADGQNMPVTSNSVNQAIQTIEKRLNSMGTADLLIVAQGTDRILVQMPGVTPADAKKVRDTLEKVAKLELKEVHPQTRLLADKVAADPENEIIPGYELKSYESEDRDGKVFRENILLKRRSIMDGSYIVHAQAMQTGGAFDISVEMNSEGTKKISDLTSKMRHGYDRMAIILDGKVLSAPTVQSTLGSRFSISGQKNLKEAEDLAAALLNPLKNPLLVDEERSVSATLGKETISQGITAGIAGLGLTMIFVLIYYRFAGLIALIGLSVNILILFGTMAMFGFTFTLPGIAGIILTIGVAVDANVLIYERLREELAKGRSVKAAISAAYDKAFSAIFDANITTLLTAVILFWRASGTVKGFAVTLTLGILASMLAALLCTRVLFWWAADKGILKNLKFMNLIPNRAFDFLGKRKISLTISAVLLLLAVGEIGIKGKADLGIDFTGGAQLSIQLDKDVKIDQVEAQEFLSGLELTKQASSQEEANTTGNLLTIRCANDDVNTIKDALRNHFEVLQTKVSTEEGAQDKYQISTETISSSLGGEFLSNAVWALLLGLLAILVYITIRFEFSFALGAFAALFHDILICLGFIILKGDELSLIHVGAFLTIAGYSINDTIVVFDRIREDLRTRRGEVEDIMNQAINTTLSRTVLTSITTFVAVLVLYIFGGAALKDFSFAIMIGVIVGTYSSIFIASPIVYLWSKMRGTNLRRELLDANLEAEVNPAGKAG
ncbi:protein translocase subunit SecD [Akkermansiaceae bacterium]|nr:protein translocase subunit SecD [Akkermansiaceae bacterium]